MNYESDHYEESLKGMEATDKIIELSKSVEVCFFGTFSGRMPLEVRPMSVRHVDAAGVFWFLSGRSSTKNKHIHRDPRVQLLFANPGASEFLNLIGFATVSDSRLLREKIWTPLASAWFPAGIDDPELTVIQVRPTGGHYWNSEQGKTISLMQLAVDAITGAPVDVGIEGDLRP